MLFGYILQAIKYKEKDTNHFMMAGKIKILCHICTFYICLNNGIEYFIFILNMTILY